MENLLPLVSLFAQQKAGRQRRRRDLRTGQRRKEQ